MRLLRRLIALFLVLWLPLQTAGAVMPFCNHAPGGQQTVTAVGGQHAHDGDHSAVHHDDRSRSGADAAGAADSYDRDLCHLAFSGFVPPSLNSWVPAGEHLLVGAAVAHPASVTLLPFDRPPRTALA